MRIYDIVAKLNGVNALLYKIKNYVSFNIFKVIYFEIFDSHINYVILIRGQNPNSKLRIITSQKKALRIINNQSRNSHSGPLFKESNILNFEEKILISNIILISKSINNFLPPIFKNWFIFSVQRFTTMTQSRRQLINFLSLPIELTPIVKTLLL